MRTKIIKPRKVSDKKAEREIIEFLRTRDVAFTDEIADALNIEFDTVNRILVNLRTKGKVEQVL